MGFRRNRGAVYAVESRDLADLLQIVQVEHRHTAGGSRCVPCTAADRRNRRSRSRSRLAAHFGPLQYLVRRIGWNFLGERYQTIIATPPAIARQTRMENRNFVMAVFSLFPDHQDVEGVRQHRRTALSGRPLASGGGPSSAASRNTLCVLGSTVMVRAPRSVGTVSTGSYLPFTCLTMLSVPSPPLELNARPVPGSKPAPSGPGADRRGRDHLHRGDVGHRHHLVAADREELLVLDVDGQAGRTFARRQRSAPGHVRLGRIDLDDLARVFEIDVELAGAIHRAELRLAAQREGLRHLVGLGIDGRGIVGPAVER